MANERKDKRPVYFAFFREVCELFDLLETESAGRVIHAACNYFLDGTEPEGFNRGEQRVFNRLKNDIDRSIDNYTAAIENGKKGAEAKRRKADSSTKKPSPF